MNPHNHAFVHSAPFGQASLTSASWSQPQRQPQPPLSAGGRKRSRDEAADSLEDDFFAPASAPDPESEEEWEYGEGMTLIRPNSFIIDASSQTGTRAEEEAESKHLQAQTPPAVQERPIMRSHKSQRLDLTATPVIAEEMGLNNGLAIASSPPKTSSTSAQEPTVDAFTIHLGIGWSRISDDEDIQAAARGWAKFIENHYPLSGVHIRLQSKGLASYLVEAREGWFLFGEDLKEGRLVSASLDRTFENLKTTPPVFDSEEILVAAVDTPTIDMEAKQGVSMNGTADAYATMQEPMMNDIGNTSAQVREVGMNGDSTLHVAPSGPELEIEMDIS
jgi:hypothetical protein